MSEHHHNHHHSHVGHHHHGEISEKNVRYLFVSFLINMILSIAEIIGGIVAGSISLIGDALHNTSDAFSILIAVIAFKIGRKKADNKYTYGFKRAEVVGGFVNLILLFISGIYLLIEGIGRIIAPQPIEGSIIILISVLALLIDAATAKLSYHGSKHNSNMRMVFLHNLADALGSVGVIVSGIFVIQFDIYWIDGIVALIIASYMIYQSIVAFPKIVNILMNAAPDHIDTQKIINALENLDGVESAHHIHIWCVNENDVALECHLEANDLELAHKASKLLHDEFGIEHSNIQIENCKHCCKCKF
ncbi:MAG: cation transporter [Alphaproteobacteria bacterium]|nr:cation transporter [Alphaproteobacteria bacterium]